MHYLCSAFDEALSSEDETFVKRVADVLLYYTDYGSFMVSIEDFDHPQLVSAIAKELTLNETKLDKTIYSKDQFLLYFAGIISTSGLDPKVVLEEVQKCDGEIGYKDFTEWPKTLFTACTEHNMNVTKEIKQHALTHLQEISTEDWTKELQKPGFNMDLWTIYKPQLMNQKDAAINVLTEYATSGNKVPDKQMMINILNEYKAAKYKLKESFTEIYDIIVKKPNKDNVSYFTSWLFELGVISNEGSISALYKTVLLDDPKVIAELVKVRDKLNTIKLPDDFVEKMAQMATGNRKSEEQFVGMCQQNGQINAVIEKILCPEEAEEKE